MLVPLTQKMHPSYYLLLKKPDQGFDFDFIFLQGKLLYCVAPPEEDETVFQQMGHKPQKLVDIEGKQLKGKDKAPKQVGTRL